MSLLDEKVIQSKEVKKLVDFLTKESVNQFFTEFRIVVNDIGDCYIHVMNRDSATINFKLPNYKNLE